MKTAFSFVGLVLLLAGSVRAQANFGGDGDMVEEVTTTTTRRVRHVAGAQIAGAEKAPDAPPLEPAAQESSTPERIIHYFCNAWKDENWEKMYWAMDKKYRRGISLKKFQQRFEEDAERTGGLADEKIEGDGRGVGANTQLVVVLSFKNKRVKPRVVKALVNQGPTGYRVVASGIIPVDLSDL